MNRSRRYIPELPRDRWMRAILWTCAITIGTCGFAIAATILNKSITGDDVHAVDLVIASVTSLIVAVPVIGILSVKIQELGLANETIRLYATTDPMTGMLNRDTFTQIVKAHLGPADRKPPPTPGSLLAIDVDHFKRVNDTFGHHHGDEALKLIAASVRTELRESDLCGRMGGEEFGVYLVGADLAESIHIADRIRLAVSNVRFAPEGLPHPLSVSIGITVSAWGGDFTELYKSSDQMLYRAKNNGRNRIETVTDVEAFDADTDGQLALTDGRKSGRQVA